MLAVTLHHQRPDQDIVQREAFEDHLHAFVQRHEIFWEAPDFFESPLDLPVGAAYYTPRRLYLWGQHDVAWVYLADDVLAVNQIAASSGAVAQEHVFGPIQVMGGRLEGEFLPDLLGRDRRGARPCFALLKIKFGEHFATVAGETLRDALRIYVRREAGAAGGRTEAFALSCWSWPDSLVLLSGDDLVALVALARKIASVDLRELTRAHPPLAEALRDSLRTDCVRRTLEWWVHGRRAEDVPDDPELLLEQLLGCHPEIRVRTHFGYEPEALREHVAAATSTATAALWWRVCNSHPGKKETEAEREERLAREVAELKEVLGLLEQPGSTPGGHAIVKLLPKPGHDGDVWEQISPLATMLPEAQLRCELAGEHTEVVFRLPLSEGPSGCARLAALTAWMRNRCAFLLEDQTTSFELPAASAAAAATRRAPRLDRGYGLWSTGKGAEEAEMERDLLRRLFIGRQERTAFLAWAGAVRQAVIRPDTFGPMLDVHGVLRVIRADCYAQGPGTLQREMPLAIRNLTKYGQIAFQQRLSFSSSQNGGPTLRGELPFGGNQLVTVATGLVGIVMALPEALDMVTGDKFRAPDNLLVVIAADGAISMKKVRHVGIFKLSVFQALHPITLSALYHELGHWMIFRVLGVQGQLAWNAGWRVFAKKVIAEARTGEAGLPPPWHPTREDAWERELVDIIEDIYADAVWRRVGCNGEWSLFATQFLTCVASASHADHHSDDPTVSLTSWAKALVRLGIQRHLHDRGESWHRTFAPLGLTRPQSSKAAFDALIKAALIDALPYLRGDVEQAWFRIDGVDNLPLREVLLRLRRHAWHIWARPIQKLVADWRREPTQPEPLGVPRDAMKKLMRELDATVTTLGEHEARMPRLEEALREGQPPPTPTGGLLDEKGYPTVAAFLHLRALLAAVTRLHQEGAAPARGVAVTRNSANEVAGTWAERGLTWIDRVELDGVFADPNGGMYTGGARARHDYQRMRATAIQSFGALAGQVRAGQIYRTFHRTRGESRTDDLPESVRVTHHMGDTTVPLDLVKRDRSDRGVGFFAPGATTEVREGHLLRFGEEWYTVAWVPYERHGKAWIGARLERVATRAQLAVWRDGVEAWRGDVWVVSISKSGTSIWLRARGSGMAPGERIVVDGVTYRVVSVRTAASGEAFSSARRVE